MPRDGNPESLQSAPLDNGRFHRTFMPMSHPATIPIYPLPFVVLPLENQLLHVSEEGHKRLIRDCLTRYCEGDAPEFGIVYSHCCGICCTGVTVAITHILKHYDDGRFEIVVQGKRRFHVHRVFKLDGYDSAEIAFWDDPVDDEWDDELATQAYTLHRQIFERLSGTRIPENAYGNRTTLSMYIASLAGLPSSDKLELLRMRSENERLRFLVHRMQTLLPQIEKVESTRDMMRDAWAIARFLESKGPGKS